MKSGSGILVFLLFVLGLFSVSLEASAATSPIESHAVYVEGGSITFQSKTRGHIPLN